LPAVVALLSRLRELGCHVPTFTARAIGSGLIRLEGEESALAGAIAALRASQDVGHVVVLRATPTLKAKVDMWGPASGTIEVARTLKRMFDPADILNAGRGPI
jgi:glycolate oxidase FAD binding subunit